MKILDSLKTITSGYLNSGKSFLSVLLFIGMAALLCLGLIYPLWLFATSTPRGYTLFCGILFGAAALFAAVLRIIRRKQRPAPQGAPRKRIRNWIKGTGKFILSLGLIYLTVLLFGLRLFLAGGISLLVTLLVIGWFLYIPRTTASS